MPLHEKRDSIFLHCIHLVQPGPPTIARNDFPYSKSGLPKTGIDAGYHPSPAIFTSLYHSVHSPLTRTATSLPPPSKSHERPI